MKPMVILTGPTAVGKTELSIRLAKILDAEIISADSMQVYRHMDIGSAKVMPEEMNGVKHYLIDEFEPDEEFHVVKFVERAKEQDVPMKLWSRLQKGEIIEQDGITYTPQMVLGAPRKGLKVTYCTDTRPLDSIVEAAKDSDLFICEGMYAEKEKLAKAKQYKHMTFYEAADMAKRANVQELWLTHFSPSLVRPQEYLPEVQKIFPNAHLGKDGKSVELVFQEE